METKTVYLLEQHGNVTVFANFGALNLDLQTKVRAYRLTLRDERRELGYLTQRWDDRNGNLAITVTEKPLNY